MMSRTADMAQLAEEMSTFFEDEKVRTQARIRQCETFVNDVHLLSDSVREGLMTLLRNAEEDYSTLLHLERVLHMRECGDHRDVLETLDEQEQFGPRRGTAAAAPRFEIAAPSAAIDLSGGSSRTKDVLEDLFNGGSEDAASMRGQERKLRQPLLAEPAGEQLDEEDDSCGDFDEEDCGGLSMGIGQTTGQSRAIKPGRTASQDVAHSLPVSIPMPDQIKRSVLDIASDLEDLEEEDGKVEENHRRRPQGGGKKTSDIPKKIAEIARSLYDTSDTLPRSPSKFNQNF